MSDSDIWGVLLLTGFFGGFAIFIICLILSNDSPPDEIPQEEPDADLFGDYETIEIE